MIKQEAIGMSCGGLYGSKSKLISIRWIKIKRHFAVWQIADQKYSYMHHVLLILTAAERHVEGLYIFGLY
ncbi:hypothetical protein Pyn_00983 [Prunus yedoensis var. nudiflora]|uniref:Uncharacterized protein n=1 Tax=Prunus yedoensis var. nudiflora TaxID=2094558 RepID=A0A314UP44_PRUYE|nr:hypothetical protein Pyn_00983 [Prunus yedoensis var. nudiflora]